VTTDTDALVATVREGAHFYMGHRMREFQSESGEWLAQHDVNDSECPACKAEAALDSLAAELRKHPRDLDFFAANADEYFDKWRAAEAELERLREDAEWTEGMLKKFDSLPSVPGDPLAAGVEKLGLHLERVKAERDEAQQRLHGERNLVPTVQARLDKALAALRECADASSAYGVAEQGGAREIARAAIAEIEGEATPPTNPQGKD